MGDKGNSSGGLVAFFQQVWAGVVGVFGVVLAILGHIKLAEGNLGLFTLVLLGVGVAGLFLSCFYYAVIWKPERNDGQSAESVIITPTSNKPVVSQGKKEKYRKRVRWIARFSLLLFPLLVWGGYRIYQHPVNLPPTDFKILVANFESSDAKDYLVTKKIFSKLEREMKPYGDEVKVERLNKSLGSIKAAKKAGKSQKAAIVIWGQYVEDNEYSIHFEILKESANFPQLPESFKGEPQSIHQLSEFESFTLEIDLSNEMTYLSLFTLGMYRYLDDDWQQAIQYYERALAVSPQTNTPIASLGKEFVYFYLGDSSYLLKLYGEAIKSYNQAIAINPNDDAAWNNRGIALDELGRYEEAINSYDKALTINPDDDAAWTNRGAALDELGRYEEAMNSYDKALAINPDLYQAWNNRGIALDKLGNQEEAIASYDKAITINPDLYQAWNNRGYALRKLGKHQEAIESYDKALAINPDDAAAWDNHGSALDELDKHQEAIESYDKALTINPDYDSAWNNRGFALEELNRYEEAIASYDKAIAINPDYDAAWYNRGFALEKLGKHEEAISSYDKAITINPDIYQAWYSRGFALAKLGKYEEAISSYDQAIEINPTNYQAWYKKSASYALQNDIDAALKNLEQAFSLNSELRELIKTDSDFDAIRNEQRFKDLIEKN